MRFLKLVLVVVVCMGCRPMYVVESSKRSLECPQPRRESRRENAEADIEGCEDKHYKTIGVYRLPRTDLRVDAALRITHLTYGEHYCFGEKLGMGDKESCRADVCSATPMKSGVVRSLEVTPVTVPDTSDLYSFRLRNKRRAVKRTSIVETTDTALLTGAGAYVEGPGKIVLAAIKGVIDTIAAAFGAAAPTDEPASACKPELAAARKAKQRFDLMLSCRNALSNVAKDEKKVHSEWQKIGACKALLNAETARKEAKGEVPPELKGNAALAIQALNARMALIEAKFTRQGTVSDYSVQEWIPVEPNTSETAARAKSDRGPKPITLGIGKGQSVGLCDYRVTLPSGGTNNPTPPATKEPQIRLCRHGDENMFVEVHLTPPPEVLSEPQAIRPELVFDPQQERAGLVYRLPRTLLVHVGVRPEVLSWRKPESKTDAKELLARQVKPVAFPQMGSLLRAPNRLNAGKAKITLAASPNTGMLTKIEVSKEPEVSGEDLSATLSSLTTAAGLAATRPEPPTETEDLKDENLLLCETMRHECLQGIRTDCDDLEKWCPE